MRCRHRAGRQPGPLVVDVGHRGHRDRGRREETARTDVPVDRLVTSSLALIHAAAEEVRAGALDPGAALDALRLTVLDLLAGRAA